MNDLSREARTMLDGVEGAYEPTRSDLVRVRAGVLAALPAAGAAGASLGVGASVKVVVFVVSAAVGSAVMVGGHSVLQVAKPPAPPPPVVVVHAPVAPPVVVVEAPAPPPGEGAPEVVAPPRPVVAKPAPPPAAPPPTVDVSPPPAPVAVVAPACEPAAELSVVQSAQRWLDSNPNEALRQLDAFEERCPDGALVEERLAARALALCGAGREEEGRAQLMKLEARNPRSPALVRVREACRQ